MEKQVLVNESSLVNIANALRGKIGDVHIEYETQTGQPPLTKISKTSNATSHTGYNGDYGNNQSVYDEVTIPGASSINITLSYQTEGERFDYVQVCQGSKSQFNSSVTKYGGKTLTKKTLTFSGDTVTFYFKSDSSGSSYLGYYAEITGVDENGNIIKDQNSPPIEMQVPIEVPNVFRPSQMATAISSIDKPNWDKRANSYTTHTGESKPIQGVVDSINRVITFDLSSKVKPNDYNWYFLTQCADNSLSTKYALLILPITTQWPTVPTDTEVRINSLGVIWTKYPKEGTINMNSSVSEGYPSAFNIKAYYNPATCQLRVDYKDQIDASNFSSRVDTVGQLIYRPSIEE